MSDRQNQTASQQPEGGGFEPFLDRQEVAQRFRVGAKVLSEWIRAGAIPHYRIENIVRFRWSEIEGHLKRSCRVPPLPPEEDQP
ncbi:MAG: helix-turn-helix domain-containing protein [Verrucomicrobiales bacterium]|nr:helix-turn-helix domain-containing protein [Verrucomicrobiales bacterium]